MPTAFSSNPFDHWIIDNFLPGEDAWAAYEHFYEGEGTWTHREHLYCRKKETRTFGLPPAVEQVLGTLEGEGIRTYLSKITDLPNLESDPDRFGGGQHVIRQGGSLGVHADFTHHPTTGKRRALNLLLYLNPNWRKGDGGELELWSADMRRCVRKVEPIHNRAVLFKTGLTSYHGHPDPLRGEERRSLAIYYYVAIVPGAWSEWLPTTDYRPRPWEYGLRLRRWASRLIKGR